MATTGLEGGAMLAAVHDCAVPRLIRFHKPYGVLSQFTPEGRWRGLKEFIDLPGVHAAGRLDADSEGLLLLTSDGPLQARIADPRHKMEKTYWAQVEGICTDEALAQLRSGVVLNDGPTLPARARRLDPPPQLPPREPPIRERKNIPTDWIELAIREGRNRQVRRMTAAVGLPTLRLIRVAIGPFVLDGLAAGTWEALEVPPLLDAPVPRPPRTSAPARRNPVPPPPPMTLRTKIIALAVLPLLAALGLVAFGLQHQSRDLHRRERLLIEQSHMAQRRGELRSYVDLGLSVIRPLYERGDDAATQHEALRLLGTLDYGNDGYFFVYDLQGHVLMHSRQPELVGQSLWDLRDSQGRYTIRDLIGRARAGGGYVEYEWRKPSAGGLAPKLGYVQALDRWQWMVGTGLYLDDIQATLDALDQQTSGNVSGTLLWIAAIAMLSLAAVSAGGLLLNLSEHRVAEAKLRQLARRVVQSQEEERAHLARELHDGTSQTLVSAKLLVESAVDGLQREGRPVPPLLTRALQRLGEALLEVRHISHRLRPALLDTLGLPAALERLVDEAGGVGPTVALQVTGEAGELSAEAKTALFRIAQEALTNVQKHAGAAHADLRLHFSPDRVCLTVEDDGLGFDVEAAQADPHRGLGLRHMRERMEAVGGRLRLQSAPGHTTVTAELPRTFKEISA